MSTRTEVVIPDVCIGYKLAPEEGCITKKDAILYALGLGYSRTMDDKDLKYTYENHEDFSIFPTIGCTLPWFFAEQNIGLFLNCPGLPKFNLAKLLHFEEKLEFIKPFTLNKKIVKEAFISDVQAKEGKGCVVIITEETYDIEKDGSKTLLMRITNSLFLRSKRLGTFGFKGTYDPPKIKCPDTAAFLEVSEQTYPSQALLYRLSGDYNPLHACPQFAAVAGFDKPILHGLCTYGLVAKQIMEHVLPKNDKFKSMKELRGKFVSPCWPGEILKFKFWQTEFGVVFEVSVKNRKAVICVGTAHLELREKPNPHPNPEKVQKKGNLNEVLFNQLKF